MRTSIRIMTVLLMAGIASASSAQEDKEPKYLLTGNDGQVHISGFGAPIVGFSSVDGNFAVYTGGGGAVLFNQTFYAGGYGMGLSTQHTRDELFLMNSSDEPVEYYDLYTHFGHGGFWLGYIHESYKAVHFGVSTKLGWGSVSLTEQDYTIDKWDNVVNDNVFVLNPQVEVELNLFKWFKFNGGIGYQFVAGLDKTYRDVNGKRLEFFDEADFSQPMVNISFLFGGFGNRK